MQALPFLIKAAPAVIGAVGTLKQGKAAKKAGEYNARVAEINAVNSEREGEAEALRIRDLSRIAMGRQIGAQAESGFAIGTGSALDSLMESATNAELDVLNARREASSRALSYRLDGEAARRAGKDAKSASRWGAASIVAQGVADYASSSINKKASG